MNTTSWRSLFRKSERRHYFCYFGLYIYIYIYITYIVCRSCRRIIRCVELQRAAICRCKIQCTICYTKDLQLQQCKTRSETFKRRLGINILAPPHNRHHVSVVQSTWTAYVWFYASSHLAMQCSLRTDVKVNKQIQTNINVQDTVRIIPYCNDDHT